MRVMGLAVAVGILLGSAGCDSSTEPKATESHFPDIPGLVVFYEFDGNLDNAVSTKHAGTAVEEVSYVADRNGAAGAALHVEGEGYVVVPDDPELDITGGITLAAWIRPETVNRAYNAIVDKNYDEAYSMGISGRTHVDTVSLRGYVSDQRVWGNDAVPYGVDIWTHVAFTFEDSTGRGDLYVNGELVATKTFSATLGMSDADLRIGRSFYGDLFRGTLDEVAVFRRALSPEEVQDLYLFDGTTASSPPGDPSEG